MSIDDEIPEGKLLTIHLHEKYVTLMIIAIADQYYHAALAKDPNIHPSKAGQIERYLKDLRHCMHAFDTQDEGLIEELDVIDNRVKEGFDNVIDINKNK